MSQLVWEKCSLKLSKFEGGDSNLSKDDKQPTKRITTGRKNMKYRF